jgi:polar amino acid transport system permease protein
MRELFQLLESGPGGWGDEIASGAWLTIRLALATLPFGLVIGFLVALARNSDSKALQILGNIFTTVFRGLPELLTLFIIYYGGQILLQTLVGLIADTYVEVSGFIAGMVALGLVFSAFAGEVFLAALRAISKSQIEGAHALGLNRFQTLRFVTFPQLWRYALPGIANLWLVLLKDTSLVSVIALNDLLRMTNVVVGATKEPFFFYAVACAIYLFFSIVSSFGITWIEKRAARGEARAA